MHQEIPDGHLNRIFREHLTKRFVCLCAFIGRRSRRNSFSEDSQLTIENFGGSQDQLNMVGRSAERERKFSNSTLDHIIGK